MAAMAEALEARSQKPEARVVNKKRKIMNWGKGIAIALTLFVGFIATLVTVIVSQDVDLVSEDYYAQEVDFQTEINAIAAGNKESLLLFEQKKDQLVISVPEDVDTKNVSLQFYRANNKDLDKQFNIVNSKMMTISNQEFEKGNYSVRAEFQKNGHKVIQKFELKFK